MLNQGYDVILTGHVRPMFDREAVVAGLIRVLKISDDKARTLLKNSHHKLKANLPVFQAQQYLIALEAIGAQCLVTPASGSYTNTIALDAYAIRHALNGIVDLEPGSQSLNLPLMYLVALSCLALPILYCGVVLGSLYGILWHAVNNIDWLPSLPPTLAFFLYALPIPLALLGVICLIKPLFRSVPEQLPGNSIDLEQLPTLKVFIHEIARKLEAPPPRELRLTMDCNAYLAPRHGYRSLQDADLVMGLGLPLIAGLSANQLAGVVAHMLGGFSHERAIKLHFIVQFINRWFHACAYQPDHWDRALKKLRRRQPAYLARICALAELCVRGGTKLPAFFLRISVFIGRHLTHRMAQLADSYQSIMAGSYVFHTTMERISELKLAHRKVMLNIMSLLDNGEPPKDIVKPIVRLADQLSVKEKMNIRLLMANTDISAIASYPAPGERISYAFELNIPGFFGIDAPAYFLVPNIDDLCQEHTRLAFNAPTETMHSDHHTPINTRERTILNEYLCGMLHDQRVIAPAVLHIDITDRDRVQQELHKAINRQQQEANTYQQTLLQLRALEQTLPDLYEHWLLNDMHAGTWQEELQQHQRICAQLEPTELPAAVHMGITLALAALDTDPTSKLHLHIIIRALQTLEQISHTLYLFHTHAVTLDRLYLKAGDDPRINDGIINSCLDACISDYENILQLCADTPHPKATAHDQKTLEQFLVERCGPPDILLLHSTSASKHFQKVRDCVINLGQRLMLEIAQETDTLQTRYLTAADTLAPASEALLTTPTKLNSQNSQAS